MVGRKVILTHNNADLDALASVYAMYRLSPEAEPVLPRRLHRNVDKFLLLYGRALPGFNQENLQKEDVELAYVVDSQSFDMVRGMHPTTPIYIIDHHPPESDLPPHHQFHGRQTGANTTLLVEMLIERGLSLSSLEATLLMCGIYEDTGSLTYSATTTADIQAAAWLLQQGADLDIVRDFLRHWMDDEQKELLNRLQESAETSVYQGYSVMIASAVLKEPLEDLSTVASELRDLFDTSAMFMVLQIKKNVQMIARSVVDDIHVGKIMQHFEGGGHNRAAAALVRDADLDGVLRELRQVLQRSIQPAVRVADMMSLGVQTVQAHSTVREAEKLMLHSGHEGYPVLNKNRRLVGLLTRRAVERAMHHDMHHRPVSDIMDAGDVTLRPEDSIELLKDKILDSGWGQIPVVDHNEQVIGIITRTDLISHWGQKLPHRNGEMMHRLKNSLPEGVRKLLEVVSDKANDLNYRVFLVGGIVRDLLLGVPNLDVDFVVEGEAIHLAKTLQKRYGGGLQQHDQFGTAKWKINARVAESLGYSWDEQRWPKYVDFATS
ncbi:MAG: CBS domain-containing protein, partial [Anaerolineae bacterium]|nr:CBS domain-containing protein [Anaerolineae bacterium]